jgi:hypothetical protein
VPYPTSTALPVNVPFTFLLPPAVAGAAGVVAIAVGFELCFGVLAALGFPVLGALVAAGAFVALGILVPGFAPTVEVEDSCGGVIAKTAPRPPKVPPAINRTRFIPELSLPFLRSN